MKITYNSALRPDRNIKFYVRVASRIRRYCVFLSNGQENDFIDVGTTTEIRQI